MLLQTVETVFTDPKKLRWDEDAPMGYLPLRFFTATSVPRPGGARYYLQPRNYDLVLTAGEHVSECFFKLDRFLEVGGAHRIIALADVATLRPSE